MTMPPDPDRPTPSPRATVLRASLAASRAALLTSIGTLAERDFAAAVEDGETVLTLLVGLARLERDAVQAARTAIGAPMRTRLGGGEAPHARPLPPQVVHDLAGARYETDLFLDSLLTVQLDAPAEDGSVETLLADIVTREHAAARQIAGRPGGLPQSRNP